MSNNWYSSSWTGGSSGNSSNCYNNVYNQSDGYEYGGENFSNGNNFRGGYEQIYGEDARSNDRSSYRGNYEQRYEEDAISNDRSNYRGNYEQRYGGDARSNDRSSYRGNYEQRYGEDARNNDRSNYRENCEQRYGENVRSNDSANYSDNFRGSHCGINYTGNNTERYNGHERRTHSDWTGQYYSGGTASGSDGQNKVEESYSSKKNIQDCLLEGSIVVVKQQRGRPKYQCLHCKITFFNEDHIEKKEHLGHVKHCLDVRACFEATVGKRGFGLNFKKNSSHTSECLKSEKVKTEPYQNSYEKEYIEKDIKEESERIKREVKEKSFERDVTDEDLRIKQEVREDSFESDGLKYKKVKTEPYQNAYEKEYIEKDIKEESKRIKREVKEESFKRDVTDDDLRIKQEVREDYFESDGLKSKKVKTEPYQNAYEEYIEKDIKEESERIKREVKEESCERDVTNKDLRVKQEVKLEVDCTEEVAGGCFKVNSLKGDVDIKKEPFSDINVNKGIIKTEMPGKKVSDNNEKHNITKEEATNFAERPAQEYACLKPECLATFQLWGQARSHMQQGCLPTKMTKKGCRLTVKPNIDQSREKAKKQRGMGTSMLKGVAAENEEKLVEAARNFYAERQNLGLDPSHTEVVWHLRETYRGFGLPPARIHQIVNSLRKP